MILKSLHVTNFKNIADCELELSPKINCFLGNNGMGKSNLLDAVYMMSFCKSFCGVGDPMLIKRGEQFAIVRGRYDRRGTDEEISIGITDGRRKSFRRDGKEYRRLSDHIGCIPLVLVSPTDSELVSGSAEVRRRFIDQLLSQTDRRYLEALIRYNQTLAQRNSMLRDGMTDAGLYIAIEMQMEAAADYIVSARAKACATLSEIFSRHYAAISDSHEVPQLTYTSSLTDGMTLGMLLERNHERDRILKHTSDGPHRDDIVMMLDGMPARQTASQGQSKTLTISLRLAQYEMMKQHTGLAPLLLLDDIFDKLDARRVERIMGVVASDTFGQIFITDTNRRHLDEIIARNGSDARCWDVVEGNFTSAQS